MALFCALGRDTVRIMRYPLSLSERAAHLWELLYRCGLRRSHHVKMGSYPCCYRCGREVKS